MVKDPIAYGKPLKHELHGTYSLRVSNDRVLYTIDAGAKVVTITAIAHRREVYD